VQANALELARQGLPKAPFYLTGQAGGQPFSVHAEGERVILTKADGRTEIDLTPLAAPTDNALSQLPEPVCPQGMPTANADLGCEEPPAPGASPWDEGLAQLEEAFGNLKSDNGSAFGAQDVQELSAQFGVENLFSPPSMPRYNGSIEAGIGSLTSRTDKAA
jgi:hypothetical protein